MSGVHLCIMDKSQCVHLVGMEINKICGVDLRYYIYTLCVYTRLLDPHLLGEYTNFSYESSWRNSVLLVCLHGCS